MSEGLRIRLKHGTAAEARMRTALQALTNRYPLTEWIFTDTVEVDEDAWPHSHPVLTLNTANAGDELMALAEFIHEQLHWFEEAHQDDRDRAVAETLLHYPTVPSARPEGAGDEASTRLHLIVCHLEHQALKALIGAAAARQTILALAAHHYGWVYRTVLADEHKIGVIVRSHNLLPRGLRDADDRVAPRELQPRPTTS